MQVSAIEGFSQQKQALNEGVRCVHEDSIKVELEFG